MLRRHMVLACVLLFHPESATARTTVPVDIRAAHLHVDTADSARAVAPVALADLGLEPGQAIEIESVGDWNAGPGGDVQVTMMAVFSASSTLLAPSLLHRVPDAIDAGIDIITCCTWPNNEPMDIDEDFGFDNVGTTVMVPPGATHLFISTRDNHLRDNSDPDGDCGARITRLTGTGVFPIEQRIVLSTYPNPFRFDTSIRFEANDDATTRVSIHDITGRVVRDLAAAGVPGSGHVLRWDGRDALGRRVPPGSYFMRLANGADSHTTRVVRIE